MVLTKTVIPLALTASWAIDAEPIHGIIVKYIVADEVIYFFTFVFMKEDVLLRQGLYTRTHLKVVFYTAVFNVA